MSVLKFISVVAIVFTISVFAGASRLRVKEE